MIVGRIRRQISRTVQCFIAILCTTIVHSHKHTHMSSSYKCTGAGWFTFSLGFLLYSCVSFLPGASLLIPCFWCIFQVCCNNNNNNNNNTFVERHSAVASEALSTSVSDCLEILISEMPGYVSSGT